MKVQDIQSKEKMSLLEKKEETKKDKWEKEEFWQRWQKVERPELWAKYNGGEFTTGALPDTKEAKEKSIQLYKELMAEKEQERK